MNIKYLNIARIDPEIRSYILSILLGWTIVIAGLVIFTYFRQTQHTIDVVRETAKALFQKDVDFRRWASMHGGVYVPVTDSTPPNPYLVNTPDRDIVTPSGKHLTLMNPAYMTRQIYELEQKTGGYQSHLTSLKPIRPANAADVWETSALLAFERGVPETSSVTFVGGEQVFKYMRPLIADKSCLGCHQQQGYREGEIRGGISVSVPMKPWLNAGASQASHLSLGFGALWLMGCWGIFSMSGRLGKRMAERRVMLNNLTLNENRLACLLRIGNHEAGSVQELLDFALNEVINLTQSKIGYIYLYDDVKQEFTLNTWSKDVMKECAVVNPQTVYQLEKTGLWGEAVRQRTPIMVNDFQSPHPLKKGYPEGHAPLLKYLTIPVFSDGKIVAVVAVANKETDYDQSDIRQLQLMMDSVWNIAERTRIGHQRVTLINELQQAISEIKTLSGLLPICASCKKIRDDTGYWNQLEAYIVHHTTAQFTHGICPDCAKIFQQEIDDL